MWDQNVSFTLKECVLYDINKRRSDYLDYRISQTENKIYLTLMQTENKLHSTAMRTENKLLLIVLGSTASIISSIIATNYLSSFKTVDSNYNKKRIEAVNNNNNNVQQSVEDVMRGMIP